MGTYTLTLQITQNVDNVFDTYDSFRIYKSTTGEVVDRELLDSVSFVAGTYTYEYVDTDGTDTCKAWFTYYDTATATESGYSDPISYGTSSYWYASIDDARNAGITESMISDSSLSDAIQNAQSFIDVTTKRHFLPISKTLKIDCPKTVTLVVPEPIVRIDSIELEELAGDGNTPATTAYDVGYLRIYNRHLTQGLLSPDDRNFPRIVVPPEHFPRYRWMSVFSRSRQQIKLTGVFGYTELRPSDEIGETSAGTQVPLSYGRTPPKIKECTLRLVMKDLYGVGNRYMTMAANVFGKAKRWKTDKQSMEMWGPDQRGHSMITGDPDIDLILWIYSVKNPNFIGAV